MKRTILTIVTVAAILSGCNSAKLANVTDEERGEISWAAFCAARGYDINDHTYPTVNEFLDSWCGSVEEEKAFINLGVEP